MSITKITAVALAACLTGACASTGGGKAAAEDHSVTVRVANYNWQDATVYAVRGGVKQRLGTVSTNQTERFQLRPSMMVAGVVQLMVDLIGSPERYLTPPILVSEGNAVDFRVQNHLSTSTFMIVAGPLR